MNNVLFTSYFPCIQYMSKFYLYDKITIDIYENYNRQTYRNRCRIVGANGTIDLIVPIKKNYRTKIKDIEIDYSENWQNNHYRALLSAYKNSAFYDYFSCEFDFVFNTKAKFLLDINDAILDKIIKILGLNTEISYSQCFEKSSNVNNLREYISPKLLKSKPDSFFNPFPYTQTFEERHGFAPNLSILDLIFNEGPLSSEIIKTSIKV